MINNKNTCCDNQIDDSDIKKEIKTGILYSLIPHTFCIIFIVFSAIGALSLTAFIKKILIIPYFFLFLIIFSVLLATISAVIYLKKTKYLCISGIKKKWKYLTILYSVMIIVNLFMFFIAFPAIANISSNNKVNQEIYSSELILSTQIPCSGHAPMIIDELKKDNGVGAVTFKNPNIFEVKYNPKITSPEKIISLKIFETFQIKIL